MFRGINAVVMFVFIFCGIGCQFERPVSLETAKKSPQAESDAAAVVLSFFETIQEFESTQNLTTTYPVHFSECSQLSKDECKTEMARMEESAKKSGRSYYTTIEKSPWLELLESRIAKKKVSLIRIVSVGVFENEARVRVVLDERGSPVTRDLLLFKKDGWKVFEITVSGGAPAFATPDDQV